MRNSNVKLVSGFGPGGVALMFHRVIPKSAQSPFSLLRGLEVSEEMFVALVTHFKNRRFKFMSAEGLAEALRQGEIPRKFVVLTFDDGYVDNCGFVAEYLHSLDLPWTLYLTSGFCERKMQCWWYGLGEVLASRKSIDLGFLGISAFINAAGLSFREKEKLFACLRNEVHGRWADLDSRTAVVRWFDQMGIDLLALTDKMALRWDDVSELSKSGCDIGVHTVNHQNLSRSSREDVVAELSACRVALSERLGRKSVSVAYPYGDRKACGPREFAIAADLGFEIGFTTRSGWLWNGSFENPLALPRVAVSGCWGRLGEALFRVYGMSTVRDRVSQLLGR